MTETGEQELASVAEWRPLRLRLTAREKVRTLLAVHGSLDLPPGEAGRLSREYQDRLVAELEDMFALLLEVEWVQHANEEYVWSACPLCGCEKREGHAPDCRLAARLQKSQAAENDDCEG